jgi:hypothetical protein
MKLIYSILCGLGFIIFYVITYLIHINFFQIDVVFYAAIVDGVIAALLMLIILTLIKVFNAFEKFLLLCIFLLIGYSIAISVPTVIDRSLSFYILEKIQQRGGGIKLDSFEEVFTQEYVKEHRLVDVRLTEQIQSGTITIENGCVKITEKGKNITEFSRYFRIHFLPKKRLLMGQYSDDLTDPFKNSIEKLDYQCK